MSESAFEEQGSVKVQAGEGVSPGSKLARARETLGLSVVDVAQALRLSKRQVEALEANDYEKLPGRTFVRGFVRNYARLVNLDPDRMVAEYSPVQPEIETQEIQAPSQRISFSEHHRKPWFKWLISGFVVVALLSWGGLVWLGPELVKPVVTSKPAESKAPDLTEEAPQPAAPAIPEPAVPAEAFAPPAMHPVEPVAPTAALPAKATDVKQARALFSFSGPAWVEVRDKNGKKLLSQNNLAGTQQAVEGEPPLSLVIGSAPNVKLTYKGHPVDTGIFTKADVARLTLE